MKKFIFIKFIIMAALTVSSVCNGLALAAGEIASGTTCGAIVESSDAKPDEATGLPRNKPEGKAQDVNNGGKKAAPPKAPGNK